MYEIYVDGEILYHPNLDARYHSVFNPKITMELNKSGSLTFLLPPSNKRYDSINKLKSIITVLQDGVEIFRGRVLNDEKDFNNRKDVYCEGELSYFLDSIRRPYTFEGNVSDLFKQYIDNHNAQVDDWKKFNIGDISETYNTTTVKIEKKEYEKTLDAITNLLINEHKGYLRTRLKDNVRYIDYVKELGSDYIDTVDDKEVRGKKTSQTIQFGVNLFDITEYISADDVFTVLIPLGDNGLTLSSSDNEPDYIEDESAVALFGKIWKTQQWSDISDRDSLKTKAEEYLKKGIEMAVSLTVKAVDLHLVNVDTEKIDLGDYVRVISIPHNLDKYFQCTKMVLDLVNADKSEYSFGLNYSTFTEKQSSETKAVQNSVILTQTIASSANQAISGIESVVEEIPDKIVNTITDSLANVASPVNNKDATNKEYVDSTITNEIVSAFTNVVLPKNDNDAANKKYVDDKIADAFTNFELPEEVATKEYVDDKISDAFADIELPEEVATKEYVDNKISDAISDIEIPDDIPTKEYVDSKSTTFKMIWSNPNQAAAFEPQTITLDTSQYNDICIRCRYSTNYGYEQTTFILGDSGGCVFGECSTTGGVVMNRVCRYFQRSNTAITVHAGFTNGTLNNSYCIPIAIYGINWSN